MADLSKVLHCVYFIEFWEHEMESCSVRSINWYHSKHERIYTLISLPLYTKLRYRFHCSPWNCFLKIFMRPKCCVLLLVPGQVEFSRTQDLVSTGSSVNPQKLGFRAVLVLGLMHCLVLFDISISQRLEHSVQGDHSLSRGPVSVKIVWVAGNLRQLTQKLLDLQRSGKFTQNIWKQAIYPKTAAWCRLFASFCIDYSVAVPQQNSADALLAKLSKKEQNHVQVTNDNAGFQMLYIVTWETKLIQKNVSAGHRNDHVRSVRGLFLTGKNKTCLIWSVSQAP